MEQANNNINMSQEQGMSAPSTAVPKRILGTLMHSLGAGVVPRSGAPYIAIGRQSEISALLSDLNMAGEGGSSIRFLIGKYGSGKSFLLQLIRSYAMEQGYAVCDCDLSPERRFCGGNGSGIATYRELIRNLAVKTSPDGGALTVILSRWLTELKAQALQEGMENGSPQMEDYLRNAVFSVTRDMENCVGGFDFSAVVVSWYRGFTQENEELQSAALRWLRGEYQTKSQAKELLKVGSIIDDDNWYDYLKLFAVFVRQTGYRGLGVFIDECVNLYKISNRISRENNFEMILSMFNDAMQGRAPGMALYLGGTPQFLEDTRRGLFSYEALRSRLTDGRYGAELVNHMNPVIRLRRLSDDELFALLCRLTDLHSRFYAWNCPVSDEERLSFLNLALSRAGADSMLTPRELIRDYVTVLNLLLQNPNQSFSALCNLTVQATASDSQNDNDEAVEIEL